MSSVASPARSTAEAAKWSRNIDYLLFFVLFFVFLGGYHIHFMLTGGDWDFWVDWKDRRLWVTVIPIVAITFPAAVQYMLWEKFRLPIGATIVVLGLLFGEWVNRYFNFWGWTYFPINMVWPTSLVPSAIVLDVILLLSRSYLLTGLIGGLMFSLLMYPTNWPHLAPFHMPVEYHGNVMSVADIIGYHYVRTGTPEYIRMVEKGTLRTFGKDVAPVSAFFSGFMCILVYFWWHFMGRLFSMAPMLQPDGFWPKYPEYKRAEPGDIERYLYGLTIGLFIGLVTVLRRITIDLFMGLVTVLRRKLALVGALLALVVLLWIWISMSPLPPPWEPDMTPPTSNQKQEEKSTPKVTQLISMETVFVNIIAPLLVAAVTGAFAWAWGKRQAQKKIDAAPREFVNELDKLITRAEDEGPGRAIINARAIVAARNTLMSTLAKLGVDLDSEITHLSRQIGESTPDVFEPLRDNVERPKQADPEEVYKTIEVLARMWPVKKKQIEVDLRAMLAVLGLDIRATRR